jgi:hypothetical protein
MTAAMLALACLLCGTRDRLQEHHVLLRGSDGRYRDRHLVAILCQRCHDSLVHVGLRRAGLADQGDRDDLTYRVLLLTDLVGRVDDAGRPFVLPPGSVGALRDLLVAVIGVLAPPAETDNREGAA